MDVLAVSATANYLSVKTADEVHADACETSEAREAYPIILIPDGVAEPLVIEEPT